MSDHDDFLVRAFGPQTHQNREQRVFGLVTATVVTYDDEEKGAYLLKLHGMNGQEDDDNSAPARVMTPMAGEGRGLHFFPEPGDEVVVGFVAGDTNNPIILGAVWNGEAPPPAQARESKENNVRTIVSRSGHELTFDDTAGSEKLLLKTKGGHQVVLDDVPTGPRITISSRQGRTVVLDDTPPGKVAIQTPSCQISLDDAGGILTIGATTAINLNAPIIGLNALAITMGSGGAGAVTLRASSAIALEAPAIELNGTNIALNGTAMTLGSGSSTSTIDGISFKGHVHTAQQIGFTGPVKTP